MSDLSRIYIVVLLYKSPDLFSTELCQNQYYKPDNSIAWRLACKQTEIDHITKDLYSER